jgi:signal peptidase I
MGYIPMERIEGRAMVSFFSTDGSAEWLKPWTWVSAARLERVGEGF